MNRKNLLAIVFLLAFFSLIAAMPHQQNQSPLTVIDKNGNMISKLVDGDSIKLQVKTVNPVDQPTVVNFTLSDNTAIGECTVAKGGNNCQTESLYALGWFWSKSKQPQTTRTVRASTGATFDVQVSPRPVVFVHGFGSSAEAWTTYLGDKGFLASIGVRGFAVGDGQVPGKLNLGDLANPTKTTGTIQSNAETLRDHIAAVKKLTGAQMIDLIAHSMGNLVSRYYIDRVMPGRDVAQMIMLGPPNQGTDCAYLPSSIGYYLPAALEIRPSYVRHVFNPQITHRHGIPFSIIAGTPIVEQLQSPCTSVPSDLAIALDSASGIKAPIQQVEIWHTDLNASERVFGDFVKPLLQKSVGEFSAEPDPVPATPPEEQLQFTRVFTGHVDTGSSATHTINIDNVTVASFALFDSTRSLTVTVRGAAGNVIALDPTRNGLVVVKNPDTLVYLGYGFNNPRPGPWQVTLQTTDATPRNGADYAIAAQFKGGAILRTQATTLLPKTGEAVQFSARLDVGGQSLTIREAQARIRYPDGTLKDVALAADGAEWRSSWRAEAPGLYGVDLMVNGNAPDGTVIERGAFLSVEVQPTAQQFQPVQTVLITSLGIVALIISAIVILLFRRRARVTQSS
ncbi:MAG: hypothetical protein HZB51_03575 [Chloroflexi bacterium]|nr:hypothetical protein [Chloroflexota bacterium]